MLAAALATLPRQQASTAAAADIAPLPAVQADSLVDSYGIGIHLAFLNTPYEDATAVGQRAQRPRRAARPRRPLHEQPAPVRRHQDRLRPRHQVQPDHGQPQQPEQRRRRTSTPSPPSCRPARSRASRAATSGTCSPAATRSGRSTCSPGSASSTRRRRPTRPPRPCPCSRPALAFKWNYVAARRPLAVRRLRQRAHVPRRLPALQRGQPDDHRHPRDHPLDQAADDDRGRLPQRDELDQRSPAGARGRGRRLHAPA